MAGLFPCQESARASSGSQQVSGYVRDAQGNPIVGINVIGDDYVGDTLSTRGPTDIDGYYDVDADTDGNYRITVSCADLTKRGYACLTPASVSLAGEAIRLDWTVYPAANPVQITNSALPKGNVGVGYSAQLGASGGKSPYTWQLASDSPGLPQGLGISAAGVISGTPAVNDLYTIKVKVTGADSGSTNKVFTITINPKPVLTEPVWRTNQFSMRLTGASNQNYTIQGATDLMASNWISMFMTNNATTNSFIVIDPNGTNQQSFHRVWIGP
ncbi:MAG: autotransporter protein [Verrucomicrobiales bacterium]|nr:autotransporter protein [Verrucomicrobiales bacterium]